MATNYNGPDFGFGNTEKGTLNKGNDTYVTTINDPNALHQFASYTSLFTLSALSQEDLEDTTTLLNSKPHDIILRSSGIGPDVNLSSPATRSGKAQEGNPQINDKLEALQKVGKRWKEQGPLHQERHNEQHTRPQRKEEADLGHTDIHGDH